MVGVVQPGNTVSHAWVWPPVVQGKHAATHEPGGSDPITELPSHGSSHIDGGTDSLYPLPPPMTGMIDDLISDGPTAGLTLDGSQNVETWTGKAGKIVVTQATAAKRPLLIQYPTGGFALRKVVRVTQAGAQQLMQPAGGPAFAPLFGRSYTCAVLSVGPSLPNGKFWGCVADGGGGLHPAIGWNNVGGNILAFYWADAGGFTYPFTYTGAIFLEICMEASPPGLLRVAINRVTIGTAGGVGNSAQMVPNRMVIGGNYAGNEICDAAYAFVRYVYPAPPVAERDALFAWAKARYDLQAIP